MTGVEQNLRNQREAWGEICNRVLSSSVRDLPPEQPRRIVLFGLGSSHYAARLTGLSLLRQRNRVRIPVIAGSSMEVGREIFPQKGDWAFCFTHRARPGASMDALSYCEQMGAVPILVCGQGAGEESGFIRLRTVPLETVEPHTISVTGAICAVTSLLMGENAAEEWDALRSLGNPDLEHLVETCPEAPSVLIGEYVGQWLAKEAALKIMEMARLPVRAFGSEEFYHGPRYSVTKDNRLWWIAHRDDERGGSFPAAHRVDVTSSTPLGWVPALVQLQWLALALATRAGVDPDKPESAI